MREVGLVTISNDEEESVVIEERANMSEGKYNKTIVKL